MDQIVWIKQSGLNSSDKFTWTKLVRTKKSGLKSSDKIIWTKQSEQNCPEKIIRTKQYGQNCLVKIVRTIQSRIKVWTEPSGQKCQDKVVRTKQKCNIFKMRENSVCCSKNVRIPQKKCPGSQIPGSRVLEALDFLSVGGRMSLAKTFSLQNSFYEVKLGYPKILLSCNLEVSQKFVVLVVVMGHGWVCKPILVLSPTVQVNMNCVLLTINCLFSVPHLC